MANLGTSGHGPFQYIRTFEVYGLKKRPKISILAFDEGNDLEDVEKYLEWKSGSWRSFSGGYEIGIANPAVRLAAAFSQTGSYVRQEGWDAAATTIFGAMNDEESLHPRGNLAMIRCRRDHVSMLFIDREQFSRQRNERTENRRLELVAKFRSLSEHDSLPIILFIPEPAPFTRNTPQTSGAVGRKCGTSRSGENACEDAIADLSKSSALVHQPDPAI